MKIITIFTLILILQPLFFPKVYGQSKSDISPEMRRGLEESMKDAEGYIERDVEEYRRGYKPIKDIFTERKPIEAALKKLEKERRAMQDELQQIERDLKSLGLNPELEELYQKRLTQLRDLNERIVINRVKMAPFNQQIKAERQRLASELKALEENIRKIAQSKKTLQQRLGLRKPQRGGSGGTTLDACFVIASNRVVQALTQRISQLEAELQAKKQELDEILAWGELGYRLFPEEIKRRNELFNQINQIKADISRLQSKLGRITFTNPVIGGIPADMLVRLMELCGARVQ